MKKLTAFCAPVVLLALFALPATVAAQGAEVRRPYRGLFGGDPSDKTASSFTVELTGAYDDNILTGDDVQPRVGGVQESGLIGGVAATLTLQRAGEKRSAGLSGTSDVRYYDSNAFWAVAHRLDGFGRYQVNPRTTLRGMGGIAYAPLYTPVFLMVPIGESVPGDGETLTPPATGNRWSGDYSIAERPSLAWQGSFDVSHALTSRASISGRYMARYVDFIDEDETERFHTVSFASGYRVARYSTLRAGYGLNWYRLTNEGPTRRYHDFDIGIDYSRPLSLSGRRTRFTVTPGFTLLDQNGTLQFHATGSVTLDHEIARTWTAKALYSRGVRFVEQAATEVLANTAQAGVRGLLNRRLEFVGEAHMVMGDEDETGRDYRAVASSARFNYALSRRWAAYAQYIYYNYRLGEELLLPGAASGRSSRQGIRVGVSVWTPLFQ